jgi:formylglycine-generating enzyme required for sulfatase activity
MQTWRWVPAALLLAIGGTTGRAGELRITSSGNDSNLVFVTATDSSSNHHYRIERATSLVSSAWTPVATRGGVVGDTIVTNGVVTTNSATFYRVVATSNSTVFVDGAYMSIDISGGTGATSYAVSCYPSATAVPGGITNDAYKTTNLLMRLIPNGTFTMGSPSGELGRQSNETQRAVTLTKDFYMGVFEVTQRQWELVMGNKPSYFGNRTYYQTRPVEGVSYYDIRENPANIDDTAVNWPTNSAVNANSFMGKLRAKTGLSGFDLPTESQWEYACRAGTGTAFNSGKNITDTGSCPNMAEVGRYWFNGGSAYMPDGSTAVGTAKVGSYLPNAWGLYDMHGNVWEWCLDWHTESPPGTTDPVGADTGSLRVIRGGCWINRAWLCRSALRGPSSPSERNYTGLGFRLSRTLP